MRSRDLLELEVKIPVARTLPDLWSTFSTGTLWFTKCRSLSRCRHCAGGLFGAFGDVGKPFSSSHRNSRKFYFSGLATLEVGDEYEVGDWEYLRVHFQCCPFPPHASIPLTSAYKIQSISYQALKWSFDFLFGRVEIETATYLTQTVLGISACFGVVRRHVDDMARVETQPPHVHASAFLIQFFQRIWRIFFHFQCGR